ncbi:MAG TPA: transcription antitermination factor NusB [Burkholderiales bacterium]|nr:transcription antitermination factor NusB [Burkholderiales bacterium]
MKRARRQSREVALQSLYAWQLSGGDVLEEMKGNEGFERSDQALAESIVRGVREEEEALKDLIARHIDRPFERLSPVERAILYIGAFELRAHPETPFKVVINEAVELGKSFGASEGHRFVNGVLERVAEALRPEEVAKARRGS